MFKVYFNQDKCKGCELCSYACPQKIIIMDNKFNYQGYYTPYIPNENVAHCVGCACCGKICPDSAITIEKEEE